MTEQKKAPHSGEAVQGRNSNTNVSYDNAPSKSSKLPRFSSEVRNRWMVKRDGCGDEFIALNGKKALGNGGYDHIYLISSDRVGVWLTCRQIHSQFKKLAAITDGKIEQLGDGEGVISCSIDQLDALCAAVGARRKRHITDATREHLMRINPLRPCGELPIARLKGLESNDGI